MWKFAPIFLLKITRVEVCDVEVDKKWQFSVSQHAQNIRCGL